MCAPEQLPSSPMAEMKQRGNSWLVRWRPARNVKAACTTWPDEPTALKAKRIAEAHNHKISAQAVYEAVLGPLDEPTKSDAPTLAEWIETVLEAKTNLTPGTLADYRSYARLHINPHLGHLLVDELGPTQLGKWVNTLRGLGCAEGSITRYWTVVYSALEAARNHRPRLIEDNPCRFVDFTRDKVRHDDDGNNIHAVYLDRAEYKTLRAAAPKEWRDMLDFMIHTGVRVSELFAISLAHLVPATEKRKPKVRVWRAWKHDPTAEDPADRMYLGSTKGRSKRELVIDPKLWDKLQHRFVYASGPKKGKPRPPESLLFVNGNGGRIDDHNFRRDVFEPSVIRAARCPTHPPARRDAPRPLTVGKQKCGDLGGLTERGLPCRSWAVAGSTRCQPHSGPEPKAVSRCECPGVLRKRPGPHDMRHSMAAWLLSDGVQPVMVQRRLGHQKLETTTETYGGLLLDDVDESVLGPLSLDDPEPSSGADDGELAEEDDEKMAAITAV